MCIIERPYYKCGHPTDSDRETFTECDLKKKRQQCKLYVKAIYDHDAECHTCKREWAGQQRTYSCRTTGDPARDWQCRVTFPKRVKPVAKEENLAIKEETPVIKNEAQQNDGCCVVQ